MPESFLHLNAQEQSQIYRALAPQLARTPVVLEKDVWVCWVLQTLFTMPDRLPMAFKGGTSLSKVFGAIARFSKDVDITLDYRGLDGSFDPFAEGVSRNRLKKFSEDLKSSVRGHAHGVVAPHFQRMLARTSSMPMHSSLKSAMTASRCGCTTRACWRHQETMWATVS